jgi:hypothetical protein
MLILSTDLANLSFFLSFLLAYGFPVNINFVKPSTPSQFKSPSSVFTTPTKPHMLGALPPISRSKPSISSTTSPSSPAITSSAKRKGETGGSGPAVEGQLSPSRPGSDQEDDAAIPSAQFIYLDKGF